MTFVLDASVTLAWFHADERTPGTGEVLVQASQSGAWAPSLWPIEVANGLRQAVRPLATLDDALRRAAGSLSVPLLGA